VSVRYVNLNCDTLSKLTVIV